MLKLYNLWYIILLIGYSDGFRRDFSNGWEVLIKGKRAPIKFIEN